MSAAMLERVVRTRIIPADVVLRNEVDLRAYPYPHLAVLSKPGFTGTGVTELLAAVDHVTHYFGFELISVTSLNNTGGVYAFLRRRTS